MSDSDEKDDMSTAERTAWLRERVSVVHGRRVREHNDFGDFVFVPTSHSVSVEYNTPQDNGESALCFSVVAFAKQRRSIAPELKPATVGVGQGEDPMPKVA